MRTYNHLTTFSTIILFFALVNIYGAEGISEKDKIIIHDKAFKLIESYQNMINRIGDDIADVDKTKSNIELFIDLYVNRKTLVYNDLDPAHQLSEYYEVETYISNLSLWYPDGQVVELGMDNASVSNIMDHGDKVYSIDIAVEKNIDGNYLNRAMNTNTEKLLFRIAFTKEGLPDNFKIAGIRDVSSGTASFDNSSLVEVKSADFSVDQVLKIHEYCRSLVNDYTNYMALLGNEEELEDDKVFYREALKGLFVNTDNNIYNDLKDDVEDKYLGIEEYIASYSEIYPVINNISLNTDSADFGKVIKNDDGTFYIESHVDKFFSGKPRGKDLYRTQERLVFKIKFEQKGESFSGFIVESVDDEGVNNALMSGNEQTQNITEFAKLGKLSRQGWYIGGNLSIGQAGIINQNISDFTLEDHYHEWDIEPSLSYGASFRLCYMLNDFLGFETGIGYSHVQTKYLLNSGNIELPSSISGDEDFRDDFETSGFYDPTTYYINVEGNIRNDEYNKIIQIDGYDSTLIIENLNFPLHINTILGKPGKISLNVRIGIDFNYSLISNYELISEYQNYFIYGSELKGGFNFIYAEDDENIIGLYEKPPFSTVSPVENESIKKFYMDGVIGIGAEIPLSYFLYLYVGASAKTSFVDLSTNDNRYVDIFGRTENDLSLVPNHVFDHKPTKVNSVLFEIGIRYKL